MKNPLKMNHNRQWRTYFGGKLMEEWQGIASPSDGNKPEEWVASVVEAIQVDHVRGVGLSTVQTDTGDPPYLRDIIHSNPAAFLGEKHVKQYGESMAVLVKVIDSLNRLPIQVHPDKAYAKELFHSDFGKTEAWYIIGGRNIEGQEPYILMGFKEGVTREKWREMMERQDVDGMISAMHRFPVKPGDVFLVEGGVPHAIGSGVFLIEVQEPTDLTMRVEEKLYDGSTLPEFLRHQGLGYEKMLDCFHYDNYTRDEILKKWYKKPRVLQEQEGNRELMLLSPEESPCFSMRALEVAERLHTANEETFSVVVVISGSGKLRWSGKEITVNQSEGLFIPASLGDLEWINEGEKKLNMIRCYPPIGR